MDGAGRLAFEEEAGADDLGPVEGIAGIEVVDLLMGADGLLEIPLLYAASRIVAVSGPPQGLQPRVYPKHNNTREDAQHDEPEDDPSRGEFVFLP